MNVIEAEMAALRSEYVLLHVIFYVVFCLFSSSNASNFSLNNTVRRMTKSLRLVDIIDKHNKIDSDDVPREKIFVFPEIENINEEDSGVEKPVTPQYLPAFQQRANAEDDVLLETDDSDDESPLPALRKSKKYKYVIDPKHYDPHADCYPHDECKKLTNGETFCKFVPCPVVAG